MSNRVEVGRIVKPHGLRGDVVVELITDREERLAPASHLELEVDGGYLALVVDRSSRQRPPGARSWARWVVHFEGHDHVDAVEAWRGRVLYGGPLPADDDTLWVDDLVGAEVVTAGDGRRVGACVALVANPAADLLELDNGALVPVVFVVGAEPGRVVIDPPAGLFDL